MSLLLNAKGAATGWPGLWSLTFHANDALLQSVQQPIQSRVVGHLEGMILIRVRGDQLQLIVRFTFIKCFSHLHRGPRSVGQHREWSQGPGRELSPSIWPSEPSISCFLLSRHLASPHTTCVFLSTPGPPTSAHAVSCACSPSSLPRALGQWLLLSSETRLCTSSSRNLPSRGSQGIQCSPHTFWESKL